MNWDWHFVFEVICQFVMHEKSLETFINELGLTLCIWSYMSVCYQWNYLMLLVAYKKKRRRRKIGETEKENEQLSDFWQLPMSAVTTYLLYPNRQIPQVLGRYTFLIITKHLAKCASYWQMTILKWFVLCEWRNAPAMITSASNMADQQHEPVFVTACVCHSLCLSLPVFVTACACHCLCLSQLECFLCVTFCQTLLISVWQWKESQREAPFHGPKEQEIFGRFTPKGKNLKINSERKVWNCGVNVSLFQTEICDFSETKMNKKSQ